MEVNPARAATGASMSAANTAAFVNMLRVFTIHGTSIGNIISNFSAADEQVVQIRDSSPRIDRVEDDAGDRVPVVFAVPFHGSDDLQGILGESFDIFIVRPELGSTVTERDFAAYQQIHDHLHLRHTVLVVEAEEFENLLSAFRSNCIAMTFSPLLGYWFAYTSFTPVTAKGYRDYRIISLGAA